LPLEAKLKMEPAYWPVDDGENQPLGEPKWHALWTRSHFEQSVYDQLAAKQFDVFLPKINVWSRRAGLRCLTPVPLFPGYLFVRRAIDKQSYIDICKTRGLVRILGERWDRLAAVPENEIESIQRVLESSDHAVPHAFVREGQRVRISRGPLKDVEGILLRIKPDKGLFVVSIDLLQRSVAVEIDCTLVAAA
jgi:transcription termination/antitermination protein NusG